MVLELAEPEIVTLDEFKVAGLAHRGPPGEQFDELWVDFNERVGDLAEITPGDDSYGVIYEYDEGDDDFTYVAGVSVEDTSGLAPELTIVEIPSGPYAVFETPANDMSELLAQIDGDWSIDAEYERVYGPMFERYGADYDPTTRDGSFELYVPVDEA